MHASPGLKAYLHPLSLTALVVLILNDHIFKGSGLLPDLLTGKLSDFAGLFVFPLLCVALIEQIGRRPASRRLYAALCLLIGAFFSAVQLIPGVARAYRTALDGLPTGSWTAHVTMDPTDLVALVALVAAYAHGTRTSRCEAQPEK